MKRLLLFSLTIWSAAAMQVTAQEACQTYRLVYQTVYDEREVTAYRIDTETVYDQQTVTRYRPVYETEMRERRYTVARPVTETAEREERYKVLRPVWETQMRDASYDRVRDVVETSEREERYTVQRPVMETQEREERYIVQRPVVETAEREQCTTVVEPVTTYRTNYVDQGGYVDQVNCQPGRTYTALRWVPGTAACDPVTGQMVNRPGGLAWVPFQGPATTTVNRVLAAQCRGRADAANQLRPARGHAKSSLPGHAAGA